MSNFAEDIERAAEGGDGIVYVIIGTYGWGGFRQDEKQEAASKHAGELLTWEEARPLLDYEYDTGYGAPECHAVYAWTAERVVFVSTYDGSTYVTWVPRDPITIAADDIAMPGGG